MSSDISRDMNVSTETNVEQDLFQFYIRGVTELLSCDDFSPSSSSTNKEKDIVKSSYDWKLGRAGSGLFCNAVGDELSGFKKARLLTMLRQSVVALTHEADEMLDPVLAIQRLRCLMGPTKENERYQDTNSKDEKENHPHKRLKLPSSSPVDEGSQNGHKDVVAAKPLNMLTRCCNSGCAKSSKTETYTQKHNPDESKPLCDNCLKQAKGSLHHKDMNESFWGSSSRDNGEVNDDLQLLMVNKSKAEEKLEKHSAELSATLGRMQEKVEELLDIVISSCRSMRLAEKVELKKLIEKLPPKNLQRVVEIINRGKHSEKQSTNISVDLNNLDGLTLWRLYFYVKAVENAEKVLV